MNSSHRQTAALTPRSAGRVWWATPVALGLGGCGLVTLLLCLASAHVQARYVVYEEPYPIIVLLLAAALPYLAASWLVWRAPAARSTLVLALVFAAGFRVVAVCTPPALSTDLYRYIWDGRVQAAGINPYRYAPADPALAHLRDEAIYPEINRPEGVRTIYPPVAQAIFFLTTRISESVTWLKAAWVLFEALGIATLIGLLRSHGLPAQRVLLYAWHPLPLSEFAGNGHVDALIVTFVLLALYCYRARWHGLVGIALGAAALSKLFPLLFAPALWRRWNWRMPVALAAVVVVGYLPYVLTAGAPPAPVGSAQSGGSAVGAATAAVADAASATDLPSRAAGMPPLIWKIRVALGSFDNVDEEDQLLSGNRFYLVHLARVMMPTPVATVLFALSAAFVLGGLALWAFFRPDAGDGLSYLRRAFALATVFTVLLSPGYPWYFCWLVPFLCFVPVPAVFWMTLTACVLYANWLQHHVTLHSCIFLPAAALWLAWAGFRRRDAFSWRLRADSSQYPVVASEKAYDA